MTNKQASHHGNLLLQAHGASHLKTKARKVASKRIKEDESTKIEAAEVIFHQVRSKSLTAIFEFCVGALDTAGPQPISSNALTAGSGGVPAEAADEAMPPGLSTMM